MLSGLEPTIWMYWTYPRPFRERPPYIDACIESVFRNSNCAVRLCDERTARRFAPDLPGVFDRLTANHQSDVFRAHVLADHGGMYVDVDTVVLRPLSPLFAHLRNVELVGADWRPSTLPESEWQPLGISVVGPVRPRLRFMTTMKERQLQMLAANEAALNDGATYPFSWEALMGNIMPEIFRTHTPSAILKRGGSTWFGLVGGPDWQGGEIGQPMQSGSNVRLPESELFNVANSQLPDSFRYLPLDEMLKSKTILGELLLIALEHRQQGF